MCKFCIYKRILLFLLATIGTFFVTVAQTSKNDGDLDSIVYYLLFQDSIAYNDFVIPKNNYDYIYTTGFFNSQSYYHGRIINTPQWNIIPQLSYLLHNGIGINAVGLWYQTYTPHWSYTNISINYFSYLDKKNAFHCLIGYSYYIYSDGSELLRNSIDASIGYRLKKPKIGTKFTTNISFGDGQTFEIANKTYAHIPIKKNSIYIRPQISINYAELSYITELNEIKYTYSFVNTQLDIPLRIILQNFDFEIGYYYNMPIEQSFESKLPNTKALHASIGYVFPIKRPLKSQNESSSSQLIQERIQSNTKL